MMIKTSALALESGLPPGTVPEDYDQGGQACEPSSPRNQLLMPGISILEKLIKTCPVWLQLGISPERASEILQREAAGIFLVKKNLNLKKMVLSVRFPDQSGAPHIQDILIKEEKTLLYLEGSVLVFDDIFKLVAFYCVSRDVLPFTLSLPQVIKEATKYEHLETVSSLGSDFWGSSLNRRVDVIKGCTLGSSNSSPQAGQHFSNDASQCSCEIELSIGNDRLWYVNPIFIEEYCNSLPSTAPITRSLTTPNSMQPRYKRPPPIPPRPRTAEELFPSIREAKDPTSTVPSPQREEMKIGQNEERSNSVTQMAEKMESSVVEIKPQKNFRMPPVPPRRRLSEKFSEDAAVKEEITLLVENQGDPVPVATLISIEDLQETVENIPSPKGEELPKSSPVKEQPAVAQPESVPQNIQAVQQTSMKTPPIPPPRRKKQMTVNAKGLNSETSNSTATKDPSQNEPNISPKSSSTPGLMRRSLNLVELKVSDTSLYSPEGNPPAPSLDHDSYSTSSTEDDFEHRPACPVKRHPTIMLDKAKQRLSMVNLPNMFTIFLSSDRKIQKKITELAQDKDSYFGNLVRDYKAFTLETMKKHSSSTEMLQEIRQMMTQLKCYLIQSTELQGLEETAGYSDDRLEAVIEAALCKSVLKPLKDSIYTGLKEIHTNDSSLKSLKENQQVVLNTTTTDLGVTTSVPETPVMEKIQHKFTSMHQAYSPEKKIATLLKTCKIIYESMSIGCPGKPHGADDFLPVLMYVLVRSNLPALLLDVEYMMELMDPTLQLGEGSYYLTTTYGALEHIKNYGKLAVTRQLSLEIQDSIHRWERRRTLNKARVSRSSVQDFINVSFNEAGSNTKTLGARPDTTAQDLCRQCAEKFEVLEPERYGLCVLVEGIYQQLGPQELPLTVKATFHHSEPKKEYYFVYKPVSSEEGKDIEPPLKTESLI
ncbi:ras and Rab interactor 3-like [Huso huso]|uniref:Ras and Rab interactor 3-like n=1 Tax=Huso huso TaxID=61971 RepID=A0ABR0Z2S4_HUSHU